MSNDYDEFNSWKALLYADKCRAILDGEFLPPVMLHVYPTNKCNGRCNFCIMKTEQEYKTELEKSVFERLVQSANDMGVKGLQITGGGEPLLYSHLHHIQKFNGFKLLATNGSFLTPEIASMFDRIRVSLNAGNAKTHSAVMGLNNFSEVIVNMRRVKKHCPNVTMGIGFVLSFDNWHEVFDVCEIADSVGADFVHIRPAFFADKKRDKKVREIVEAAYHLCEAAKKRNIVKVFAISEKFDGYWTERKYKKCLASPLNAVVTATGELVPCLDVFIRFGDLNKNTFEEIWGSEEHKKAIAKIEIEKCPRCVMTKPNEIIENVFIKNKILAELL